MTDIKNNGTGAAAEDVEKTVNTVENTNVQLAQPHPSLLMGLGKWALAGVAVGGLVVGGIALYNKFFGAGEDSSTEA